MTGVGGRRSLVRPLLGRVGRLTAVLMVLTVLIGLALAAQTGPARALPLAPSPTIPPAPEPLPAPAVWPLGTSPPVLRGFDPPEQRYGAGHRGVDLGGQVGQDVVSAAAGTVTYAGRVAGVPVVSVDHGGVRTTYQPVQPRVGVGQRVRAGQLIGRLLVGHCPQLTDGAACLHWGLRQGSLYLDPLLLIPADDGATNGHYRLVAADEVAAVRAREHARESAARAAAAAGVMAPPGGYGRAGPPGPIGPAGRHGFAHPVAGPITSPFGRRFHPILRVWKLHDGTDFGAACGTAIRAPYSGRVVGVSTNPGYGNRLMVDHGVVDGHRVITGYNHALGYVVAAGALVHRGQLLGFVGETGYATGCHLHLMAWIDGGLVDPMRWF